MPLLDEYKDDGVWLRRWQLVAGRPRCLQDAVALDHPEANAIRARNDRVRDALWIVRAYEAAQRLITTVEAGDPLAETMAVPVMVKAVRPNPAHARYLDALDLLTATADEPPELVEVDGMGEVPNPARLAWLAAHDVVAAGEPPETVTVLVDGTEEQPNPAWATYQEALALVADADDSTRALALLRATGEPPAELLDDGQPNPDQVAWDAALDLMEAINAGE
ncbi:hypothetical protein TSA6c_16975 [Azospirillum sp. TSA6c]|uniref:hypothetical protein n=1 Tax=Azospirillum sp. TSA6c TaxID=709813 RepID=UPI000D61A0AE|nr:hypothetical protein [Azospirillum sp. TSA6c]PWC48129.1 hypothetical protein TSA6c_16975 [Azospirillum sp. TSA6c]